MSNNSLGFPPLDIFLEKYNKKLSSSADLSRGVELYHLVSDLTQKAAEQPSLLQQIEILEGKTIFRDTLSSRNTYYRPDFVVLVYSSCKITISSVVETSPVSEKSTSMYLSFRPSDDIDLNWLFDLCNQSKNQGISSVLVCVHGADTIM